MLEVRHGLPFMFKLTLCAWYFGVLTSAFFVTKPIANRNNRYFYENPRGNSGFGKDYYFMSAHGVSSSIAYYWLYKNMAILILPALLADLYIWGPYYSNGPLAGLVFGALL